MGMTGASQSSCILYGVELTTFAGKFLANGGRWDSLIEEGVDGQGRTRRVPRDEVELSLERSLKIPDVDAETESDEEPEDDEEAESRPEEDEEVVRLATEIGRRDFVVADCFRPKKKRASRKREGKMTQAEWEDEDRRKIIGKSS